MKTAAPQFKGKKVLVFGLGLIGGGIATTNWLLDHGAHVTVTDLKGAEQLSSSIKRVEEHLKRTAPDGKAYAQARKRLAWAIGGHSNALIDAADIIVVNPDVSVRNPFIARAIKNGKRVCNDGTIFYDAWKKSAIGVTGTRGKTTTANWAHHLIETSVLAGNSATKPFLSVLDGSSRATYAVTELSSFILELFEYASRGPHIAIITNLYPDHLNRHGTMEEYARAKANIFIHQLPNDHLILNHDDEWTPWFLALNPCAQIWHSSMTPLPGGTDGVWADDGAVWQRVKGIEQQVLQLGDFGLQWGMHNVANVLAAALAARLAGAPWSRIQARISSLPQVPFRQEVVYRDVKLSVVNDTTATSPEGGIAAVERWGGPTCVLIAGGTDRELDYRAWADVIKRKIRSTNLILLDGSATLKMRVALGPWARGIRSYDSLATAYRAAKRRTGLYVKSVILFSPAAKSFELFANEYDRGQKFNALVG